MRRILNALGSYVMYCLFFIGGKSKTDSGAERRSALDKDTMAAIYGKSRPGEGRVSRKIKLNSK